MLYSQLPDCSSFTSLQRYQVSTLCIQKAVTKTTKCSDAKSKTKQIGSKQEMREKENRASS